MVSAWTHTEVQSSAMHQCSLSEACTHAVTISQDYIVKIMRVIFPLVSHYAQLFEHVPDVPTLFHD